MVSTVSLFQSILEAQEKNGGLPPVEKWNPPLCENAVSYTHLTLPTIGEV